MMGNNKICRSFTFFTNRIPLGSKGLPERCQYTAIGFFDGLQTEAVKVNYKKYGLKAMWKYILKLTQDDTGEFSHQNVFGIGDDDWNNTSDKKFWDSGNNEEYPLTFVVFLQALEYHDEDMEEQCKRFGAKVMETLGNEGIVYVYVTVDKNDFIVCIKCKKYKCAMKSIKQLHKAGTSIVYSYSVFVIHNEIISQIGDEDSVYRKILNENIDSISLKGVANSSSSYTENNRKVKSDLDVKYRNFCAKFEEKIYPNCQVKDKDCKTYDILGDDDFRFIARDVKLCDLLVNFSQDGCLNGDASPFREALYSSNLTLNIENQVNIGQNETLKDKKITPPDIISDSHISFITDKYESILDNKKTDLIFMKDITLYQSIKQTLESMKSLDKAETKKYEFFSLYNPLYMLLKVISDKNNDIENYDFGEKEDIYEFLRAVGSSMHGTLRTDIRFFQIRDFNTIVHYAPSKLRTFYVAWLDKVSRFCGNNSSINPSFIIKSGIYSEASVRRLFDIHARENIQPTVGEAENTNNDNGKEHLILVTVSERDLYLPKRLLMILTHEISHFVSGFREREQRKEHWENIIQRVFEIELNHFLYLISFEDENILGAIRYVNTDNGNDGYLYLNRSFKACWEKYDNTHKISDYSGKVVCDRIEEHYAQLANQGQTDSIATFIEIYVKKIFNEIYKQIDAANVKYEKKVEEKCLYADSYEAVSQQLSYFFQMFQSEMVRRLCIVVKTVISEIFSDFFAVLILGIKPEEYFKMVTCETGKRDWLDENQGGFLFVRTSIVIESMRRLCEQANELIVSLDKPFSEKWNDKAIKRERKKAKVQGKKIYFYILEFAKHSESMLNDIKKYDSIVRYEDDEIIIDEERMDYFYDEVVLDEICKYLVTCGELFWNSVKIDKNRKKTLRDIRKSYDVMSNGTLMDMAIEIERYLKEFEESSKKIITGENSD